MGYIVALVVSLVVISCGDIPTEDYLDSFIKDAAPEINLIDGNQEPDAQPEIDSSSRDSSLDVEVTETFIDSQPIDEPIIDSSYPDINEPEVIIIPPCECGDNYLCRYRDDLPTCICPPGNYINDNKECVPNVCGDGIINPTSEECDDGSYNSNEGDCLNSCRLPVCGDGFLHVGTEECDPGVSGITPTGEYMTRCNSECKGDEPYCGDGLVNQDNEECDDGNRIDDDECTNSCEKLWIRINGGNFDMGSSILPSELPIHNVKVSSFKIQRTEVTISQYAKCVKNGNCSALSTRYTVCNWRNTEIYANYPANCVTWQQAVDYCTWIGGRLPSEAEWEYAARSEGQDYLYPWGNNNATCDYTVMDDNGVTTSNGYACGENHTWEVCSKIQGNTEQDLCDMAGNTWEWVQDWYHGNYEGAPMDGSAWNDYGVCKTLRGGGLYNPPGGQRTTYRACQEPERYYEDTGFRCVIDI